MTADEVPFVCVSEGKWIPLKVGGTVLSVPDETSGIPIDQHKMFPEEAIADEFYITLGDQLLITPEISGGKSVAMSI